MRLLATDSTPVRLVLKADGLELVAIAQEVGQAHEELDAKYEGAELTVAFNPDYLIAGIEVTPGEEITLETTDSMKPALLRSIESSDFLYLLMPVRVSYPTSAPRAEVIPDQVLLQRPLADRLPVSYERPRSTSRPG